LGSGFVPSALTSVVAGVTLAETMILPYLVEMVPAKYRGMSLALSGAFNGVSQVIATVIMYFCAKIQSDMSWKIPLASKLLTIWFNFGKS
jgi:fucose permease